MKVLDLSLDELRAVVSGRTSIHAGELLALAHALDVRQLCR